MNTRKGLRLCTAVAVLLALAGCSSPKTSGSTAISQAAASVASSASEDTVSLSDILELGAKYLSNLNFEGAIIEYTAVLKADAGNKNALAGLYAAYAAKGETEQANGIYEKAEQILGNDTLLLPYVLDDADIISENGGGSDVYKSLSDRYLDLMGDGFDESENSLEQIGNAWLDSDPQNPDAYVPLSVFYKQSGDEAKLANLSQLAEENGLALDAVNDSIIAAAGEDYVITIDAGDPDGGYTVTIDTGGSGKIKVNVSSGTTAQDVASQATSQAVDNATSQVLNDAGIDPNSPGADAAANLISSTLNAGLGAMDDSNDIP